MKTDDSTNELNTTEEKVLGKTSRGEISARQLGW